MSTASDTHGHHDPAEGFDLERFTSGKAMGIAATLGVAGLALTALGGLANGKEALVSYLTAFLLFLAIALGALVLLMANHAAGAKWLTVLRRPLEAMAAALPIFALLFLPVALGAKSLFLWIDPPATLTAEQVHALHAKHAYLNLPGFYGRAVAYFLVFIALSQLFWSWSNQADEAPSAALTRKMRRLGAGGLPLLALALSFACFDWLLSLNPFFPSTMFGVYYFAGGFLGSICVLVLITRLGQGEKSAHSDHVSLHHWHNLGKYMLAFTAFWAYIAFSQFMLVWIANLPEEVGYYKLRTEGPWQPVWALLIATHFVLPFFTLLSRELKRQPTRLSLLAGFILLTCWLDAFWLVTPEFHAAPVFHWTQVTALLGVGGAAVAFALFRLRGRYAVPVGDPYLEDSLRYTQS